MSKSGTKNKLVLISNPTYKTKYKNLSILRIIISNEYTKIDFGYQATSYYIRGGWVTIHKSTYIREYGSEKKLNLIKAEHIAYAPNKIEFETTKDYLYFSLYFPPISIQTSFIDLVEKEKDDGTNFNFYNIGIKEALQKEKVLTRIG